MIRYILKLCKNMKTNNFCPTNQIAYPRIVVEVDPQVICRMLQLHHLTRKGVCLSDALLSICSLA